MQKGLCNNNFGTKRNWQLELEPAKFSDKSVVMFIDQMIDKEILTPSGKNTRGDIIYLPTEESAKKLQVMLEESDVVKILENAGYELIRNDYSKLFKL